MAGRSTQAMVAPAVRRERHDTLQCTVWGSFMRCRIADRGLSPRSGRNGPNCFPTPLTPPGWCDYPRSRWQRSRWRHREWVFYATMTMTNCTLKNNDAIAGSGGTASTTYHWALD